MSDINNQICDAIGIIVDKKLSQANFDKTIQATIVAQGDKTKGEYKVKYLDSSFYAYDKSGKDYSVGTQVYVLVPENDLSKVKTILGTADKTKDIQPIIPEGNKFEYLTNNLFIISENKEFGIKSWENRNKENKTYPPIYIYNRDGENADFKIDTDGLSYIEKEGFGYFILKCNVRTNLQKSQQSKGNYGIRVTLTADLKENQQNTELENSDSTDNIVTDQKTKDINLDFVLDSTMMVGNPYSLVIPTAQIAGFNVGNYKNITITSISLFSENFDDLTPEEKEEKENNNIFFTDLSLQCANKISADNLNGNYLYISVPEGQYISNDGKESITLKAIFQSKGQIIDPDKYSGLTYYWFKKNPLISVTDTEGKYCKINGINTEGWECLNAYDEKDKIFKAGRDTYTIDKNSFLSNQQEYRCIALFDNLAYSKTKMVYNKNPQYFISLTSDSGTIFYNNNGEPTLTCSCHQNDETAVLANYHWYATKIDGQRKNFYNEDNKEISIQSISINQYPDKAIIDCAVVIKSDDKKTFIGVGTLELLNLKSDTTMPYNLIINNGSQMFKYNTLGISPIHASSTNSNVEPSQKEKSAVLQPLSFTLINNKTGEEFTAGSSQKWILPPDNETMFDFSNVKGIQDYNKEGYRVYEGKTSLEFSIKSRYDYTKINNTILLEVVKENQTYKAKTNILFAKEGDNGTNGTDYVCQIVGIQENKEISFSEGIPYYYYNESNGNKFYYKQKAIENQLKLKVFKNGENIEIDNSQITWSLLKSSFLKNKDGSYISTKNFPYILNITNNGTIIEDDNYKGLIEVDKKDISDIIIVKAECSFKDDKNNHKLIYASCPIGVVKNYNGIAEPSKKYINNNTGFYYVIYDSDGTNPSYDNTDTGIFEVINGDSDILKDNQYAFDWQVIGDQLYTQEIKDNDKNIDLKKIKVIAKEPLLAESLNNGISCKAYLTKDGKIKRDDTGKVIGTLMYEIIIPIHLYLNRFGHAAINGWDGNTVSIDTEGGVVLAPQIGAGDKDENNAFTGVLMGTSLLKDQDESVYKKETGLMGLSHGERSFFLNSEDGSAVFGKNGSGQIKFIPADKNKKPQAIITGGSYLESEGNGKGMEINLSAPSITYGNHKFMVKEDGTLTCHDANIYGWFSAEEEYEEDGYKNSYNINFLEKKSLIRMSQSKNTTTNETIIKPGYFKVGSKNEDENNPFISYFKYDNNEVDIKGNFKCSFESKDGGKGNVAFNAISGISMKYNSQYDDQNNPIYSKDAYLFELTHKGFSFGRYSNLNISSDNEVSPDQENVIITDKDNIEKTLVSGIFYNHSQGLVIKGKLSATSGNIGGWRITDDYIASKNDEIILYADGRISGNHEKNYHTDNYGNGQTKNGNFEMASTNTKTSFNSFGLSTTTVTSKGFETFTRYWRDADASTQEMLAPSLRRSGCWTWDNKGDPFQKGLNPELILRKSLPSQSQYSWIEVYRAPKEEKWNNFSLIGVKQTSKNQEEGLYNEDPVNQVVIEAQQSKVPICFSITSDGNLASSTMKFAEPQEKKTPEETATASTLSSKASASSKASSDEIKYAELSFPYKETTITKDKNDKDVTTTKEYDGTRISAVKIITGDIEIDENAKVQMRTRSAHSLVSAVNEMLTPPDQVQYIDGKLNTNGITVDEIIETWKAKDNIPEFQFKYKVHIENKGKSNESVKYLIREDKTEGEGENKKVILPGYTIELKGF